jgi:hypothetical protein
MRRQGVGQLTTIASAIETQEGYYPGSVAYNNNNPGNLMAAGQPGCTPTSGGFCSFSSFADGWQALLNQIQLDASRGLTIAQFTAKYAPASAGNDPTTYAQNLAASVGLSPNDPLSTAIADTGDTGSANSFLSLGLPDLSSLDTSGLTSDSVDLSSIGLGLVSPLVLIAGGLGLVLLLVMMGRK